MWNVISQQRTFSLNNNSYSIKWLEYNWYPTSHYYPHYLNTMYNPYLHKPAGIEAVLFQAITKWKPRGRYAVWRLFESIYCSKLCVKRPFDAHPSSLLSLGQERTGSLGRGCRTRANWGVENPPSEGGPKSTSPFSYPEVPSHTYKFGTHISPHRAGWPMAYQSFRCGYVTLARPLVTPTTN